MVSQASENDKLPERESEEKIWPQILTILIGCLANLTCGTLLSWTSPFIVKLTTDKVYYDISEDEASYFTLIPPIAMIISSFIFSRLNDVLGRKPVLIFVAFPYIIAWILAAVAKDVWVFYVSRFFAGISDGCLYSSLPMYIGEISTPKVRGTWGNSMTFFLYLGQFIISVVGSYFNVQQTSYICICIPIVYLVLFSFVRESPYFYIIKGKYEEAKESVRYFRRKQDVEEEFLILKKDVERQMSESGTWKDLFVIVSNRRALYAGIFLRASQQLGGITAFMLYTQYMFEKSGGNLSSEVSSMIFFAAIVVLNVVGGSVLEKLGRRKSYFISTLFCGIFTLIEAIYFYIDTFQTQINIQFLNWIPITAVLLYVVFYSIGLGLIPTLMLGELFSASIKVKGLCVLNMFFGLMIIIVTRIFYLLTTYVGLYAPFLFFTCTCFLSSILSLFLVPETSGKSLEAIQQSLKGNK
ncbi:facilitated trehalose transporter Tret1-like isoform X2 [Anoplophora glabripennis]|nr:facilitated trehalose transporter Tret1-like isoform X2 [Anoplophora glabripennis]XP_023311399.1 facilitated trehalose transporter Tret1-like isoform X2 [Anoplophora glabripennis]